MQNREKYFDVISYFQYVQELIREKADNMEKVCGQLEKEELNKSYIENLTNLNNELNYEFVKYYTLQEDILFPELKKVLPTPTSTNAMRSEHNQILQFFEKIKEELDKKDGVKKDLIIYTVISFVDILRRYLHKESDTIMREAGSFLPDSTQQEIYLKILDRVSG